MATNRRRRPNVHVTKSGKEIKVHRNLLQRYVALRDSAQRRKATRLAGMPKDRLHRFLYRLQPKRLYHYWFSREGGIMALKIMGIGIAASFILLVGLFAYFRKDLSNITDISGKNLGGSVLYYDRTGQTLLWEDVNGVKRIPVKDEDIASSIKLATVAVEDKDFFHHGGFDVRGILRAGVNDAFGRGGKQGGSTITQQLVRLTQNRVGNQQTITRKIKELILAVEMERSYSKAQILTAYVNTAPYGGIEYGAEAAARNYFQKSAKDLTLDESAFLASIPKSPSLYSPYSEYFDKKALISRQHYILDAMQQQGMISAKERDDAKKVDTVAKVKARPTYYQGIRAPYFVLAAQKELEAKYSETVNRSGWKVITTLNLDLQSLAEKAVQDDIPTLHAHGADEAAFVAEDVKTGQIVSLVGGVDFENPDHGKINYAHDTFVGPGSSFKPYDYTALINNNNNVGAGSVLYDQVGPLPGYPCTNKGSPPPQGTGNCLQDYDRRSPGPLTLRYALGGSRNIPAVKAMLQTVPTDTTASVNKVINTASAMMDNPVTKNTYQCYEGGDTTFTKPTQCGGAAAIGDGAYLHIDDHVNGLATLARLGKAIPRTYILKITDAGGKVKDEWKQPEGNQVVRQDAAYIVDDMASDPRASYLNGVNYRFHRYKGWNFAIKTGTTNNGFDGLMTSWSTQYAAVSWVGYHTRNQPLSGSMELITAPITRVWMQGAHDRLNMKPVNWVQPSGVKSLPAYVVSHHVGYGSIEPSPTNDLYPSWYTGNNKKSTNQTIDIVSNKIATDCTPARAKKNSGNANSNAFSIDIFVGGGGNNQIDNNQTDDVHHCDDQKPSVNIVNAPSSCSGSCTVEVNADAGTHPLSDPQYAQFPGTLNVMIGGQIVQSYQIDGPVANYPLTFTYSGTGTHDVTVQVIDSVLYDSTSSPASIDFGSGGGSSTGPLTFMSAKRDTSHNKTTYTWSGGTGPYTVASKLGGVPQGSDCTSTNNTSCDGPLEPPGYTVTLTDSSTPQQSKTTNVTN